MSVSSPQSDLARWVGATETRSDVFDVARLVRLAATLDSPATSIEEPPLPWHWLHFLPDSPTALLGEDGHPRQQGFLPPIPAPRRMWAGSRIETSGLPVQPGESIRRTTRIRAIEEKRGASGHLTFLGLEHAIIGTAGVLLREEQDLVYRSAPAASAGPPVGKLARTDAHWCREVAPSPTLLFRFSALTFNAHRIHYDRGYATEVEGYPGLVVHGPLIAALLLDLAYHELPGIRIRQFSFRAMRPAFDSTTLRICASPTAQPNRLDLWAVDNSGFVTTEAGVAFAHA